MLYFKTCNYSSMERSSFSRLLAVLIFTQIFVSSFKPIESVHDSQDLYTHRSRNTSVSPPPLPLSAYSTPTPHPLTLPTPQSSPVPALFVIGDSSVDCGTINFLSIVARADHLPYGRDFETHQPTGRFSKDRVPVDYLASYIGLPLVPSYLGQSGAVEDMTHGLSFASAGTGITFSRGAELGQHIFFSQQIQQLMDTFQQSRKFIFVMTNNNMDTFYSDKLDISGVPDMLAYSIFTLFIVLLHIVYLWLVSCMYSEDPEYSQAAESDLESFDSELDTLSVDNYELIDQENLQPGKTRSETSKLMREAGAASEASAAIATRTRRRLQLQIGEGASSSVQVVVDIE